jgi:hypothetical protein
VNGLCQEFENSQVAGDSSSTGPQKRCPKPVSRKAELDLLNRQVFRTLCVTFT